MVKGLIGYPQELGTVGRAEVRRRGLGPREVGEVFNSSRSERQRGNCHAAGYRAHVATQANESLSGPGEARSGQPNTSLRFDDRNSAVGAEVVDKLRRPGEYKRFTGVCTHV